MQRLLTLLQFRPPSLRPSIGLARAVVGTAVMLAVATLLVVALQDWAGVPNASIVYLLTVVAAGMLFSGWVAISTAVVSFLVYDFLFVKPLHTFSVGDPQEWLDLLLFLVVAIVIGRLAALQRARAEEAEFRTKEARALFAMSRDVARSTSVLEAAPLLAERLLRTAEMARVWVGLGASIAEEETIADTQPDVACPALASRWLLRAPSAESQPTWIRVRETAPGGGRAAGGAADFKVFRVPVEAGGETVGSIWSTRVKSDPIPGRSHTRLLAAAADQLAGAIVRDRLAGEATAAEIARQGDALKSALLDSVSHDLRTPLSAIRATAGNLMDPDVEWSRDDERKAASSIDREAERLTRIVQNMIDLSRIQAGEVDPNLAVYDLADLVDPVVDRLRRQLGTSEIDVRIPDDLPAVRVDALWVDEILSNILENAAVHAPDSNIRVSARALAPDRVELLVEDSGRGVRESALPRLFERFYRVPSERDRRVDVSETRGGLGVGLAVVRGLTEAMSGAVSARRAELGGLAIAVELPAVSRATVSARMRDAARDAAQDAVGVEDDAGDGTGRDGTEPVAAAEPVAEPAAEPVADAEPAGDSSAEATRERETPPAT